MLGQAVQHHTQGRLGEAARLYNQILALDPRHADALHLLGVALTQSGQAAAGARSIRNSVNINARQPVAWANLGNAELSQSHAEEALRCYDQAILLSPDYALAHYGRGGALTAMARHPEALACFERTLQLDPGFLPAISNRCETLLRLGRSEEAVAALDAAIQLYPRQVNLYCIRASAYFALRRYDDSAADCERALLINPRHPESRHLHCAALLAIDSFERVLHEARRDREDPSTDAQLEYFAGEALLGLGRESEALAAYDHALALRPEFPDALSALGTLCLRLGRFQQAAAAFSRLFELAPGRDFARGTRLHARLQTCDWSDYDEEIQAIITAVDDGIRADLPLSFMAICDDPALQLKCTQLFAATFATPAAASCIRPSRPQGRLRIAYLSADFLEHPVAYLLSGVIDAHDRGQFEIIGISLRADERSPTQERLSLAFDRFVDATGMSDAAIAALVQDLQVDIAVDLMGYTAAARPGVFARRAAPIQVSYLGYPGTQCAPYIDYLIADPVVIPPADVRFYSEEVVQLPGCYLPNDDRRQIGTPPTRVQAGLPQDGLIFCAMTHPYKINPPLFAVWARLLHAVPTSVLWVRGIGAEGRASLERELQHRGVEPERLRFASHVPAISDHLARLTLADLCLDTFPYNSHSTACDALWAGVPVLTCAGRAMASRVAASALTAVGLGDLITQDLSEYEDLALALALTPGRLRELRERLRRNRDGSALFGTAAYTRALERAFLHMRWQRMATTA